MCSNQVNIIIQIKGKGGTNETEEGKEKKVHNPVCRNTMIKMCRKSAPSKVTPCSTKETGMMLTNWLT